VTDIAPIVASLATILTELQAQSITLSSSDSTLTTLNGTTLNDVETLLNDIDANTDGLEGLATTLNSLITTLDAVMDSIKVDTGNIDASLNAIESDVEANRLKLIDILTELESIDANWNILSLNSIAQLAIDAILVVINTRLSTGGTNISEQANLASQRHWVFAAQATVTSLAGGSNTEWTITFVDRTDLYHIRTILDTGGSGGVIVTANLNLTTGNHVLVDFLGEGQTAATSRNAPKAGSSGSIAHFIPSQAGKGTELKIAFSNVVVNDVLRVAVSGLVRSATAPVVDTANSTSTNTFLTHLNQVDANP